MSIEKAPTFIVGCVAGAFMAFLFLLADDPVARGLVRKSAFCFRGRARHALL
jgi:hypothetical protein